MHLSMTTEETPTLAEKTKHYRIPVYRVALVRERSLSQLQRPQIRGSYDAAQVLAAYLADADREHLVVLMLNPKHRLIGINTVSVGCLTTSLAHPRELFKPAIVANAAAVIVGHNHPSDDPALSAQDTSLSHRLHAAGELLGIRLLDHVIIGEADRWYSFQDAGVLPRDTHASLF